MLLVVSFEVLEVCLFRCIELFDDMINWKTVSFVWKLYAVCTMLIVFLSFQKCFYLRRVVEASKAAAIGDCCI